MLFDTDHELWKSLCVDDCLAVFGCARYGAWVCFGECAILELDQYFAYPDLRSCGLISCHLAA